MRPRDDDDDDNFKFIVIQLLNFLTTVINIITCMHCKRELQQNGRYKQTLTQKETADS
jgi:hypothetical protein